MEFWGVEVKPGATVKCEPEKEKYIHLSQASLGESKGKGSESVLISVKVDDKNLVLGTLSLEKCPQISYDLVFEKEFELSHNSKSASVYFCGYRTGSPEEYPLYDLYLLLIFPLSSMTLIFFSFSMNEMTCFLDLLCFGNTSEGDDYPESESEEENVPADLNAKGKPLAKQEQGKPASGKAKAARENGSAAKKVEPAKVEKPKSEDKEDGEDSDDSEDDSEEDSEDDEDMVKATSDSDDEDEDEDDSSEEEDEATPKKAATGKRPAESASKTPAPEKKAKLVTPAKGQKTGDGKKVVHVATPHPSKKAGKTPANSDKSKQQTPKSAGSVTCKSCDRNFNSENALQAHTKAKHG